MKGKKVGRRTESLFTRGPGETVPGTDLLTSITTVEAIAQTGSVLRRDIAFIFDGEVGDAFVCVQTASTFESTRRTSIQATMASAATVLQGTVVIEFQRGDDLTEEEERAFTGDDKVGVLSDPAEAGFPGPVTFKKGGGVGEGTGFRGGRLGEGREKLFRDILPELAELVLYYNMVVFSVGVIGNAGSIGGLFLCRIIVEGDGDNGAGTFHQAGGVETDIPVVLHIFHSGMVSFGYPPVKNKASVSAEETSAIPQASKPNSFAFSFILIDRFIRTP